MKRAMPLLLLVLVVGCRTKLNDQAVLKVHPGVPVAREIDPITSDQKVNISAKADSGEFDIYFFLAKDVEEVERNPSKAGAKLLDHKTKVSEANLSGTVPAKETGRVLVMSADGKKVDVNLKITN